MNRRQTKSVQVFTLTMMIMRVPLPTLSLVLAIFYFFAPNLKGALGRAEKIVTEEDRKHWSYLPLQSPALPVVKNAASVRTSVDRFILAALETNKLALSPTVEGGKLARRIYFDLIGLPPTPEQIQGFLRAFATQPQAAVESLVDELLASPH